MNEGLLLNNTFYPIDELIALCEKNIKTEAIALWERKIYQFILEWLDDREHILQYSSGTTGRPKGLILPKKSMVSSAGNTCDYLDLSAGRSAFLCLPVDFIAGKMMVVRAFAGKLNLLIAEPTGAPDLSVFEEIDFCAMVPLQVSNLLKNVRTLQKIKKLIIGGAEISPELEDVLHNVSFDVYATYGMAETCSHIAMRKLSGPQHERHYTALPGVKFTVDDRNCLVIEAAYLNNTVITNDLVDLIDERRFSWKGRYDNLINSGGIKVVPEEIETVISRETGRACAIIGLPDPALGQKVVLVMERHDPAIEMDKLKKMLSEKIPKLSQPKKIIIVDRLPLNRSFKVDRNKLVEQLL